jgi:hypothetical protein
MSLGAVFVGLMLFGLTAYVASFPWRREARQGATEGGEVSVSVQDHVATLEAQAESSSVALADLDFDRSIGKVNDEDYRLVRGQLMAQTVAVLKRIDTETGNVERQVEALVSQRRAARAQGASPTNGRTELSCPSCGTPARSGDRFCVRCGSALAMGAATA